MRRNLDVLIFKGLTNICEYISDVWIEICPRLTRFYRVRSRAEFSVDGQVQQAEKGNEEIGTGEKGISPLCESDA